MKVALVYDRVNKFGGAERVLLALHRLFPDAPLYTLVYDRKSAPWADVFHVVPSFLNRFWFLQKKHEILAPLAAMAFESFDLRDYDVIISITSSDAKAVITKPNQLHICYCLTPTRYFWSGADEYAQDVKLKLLPQSLQKYFRTTDLLISKRPDQYIAISNEVKARISKFYHRDSSVIYPSIDDKFYTKETVPTSKRNYYLIVSRLVPYKKVDLAINAFNELERTLTVVGSGSELFHLLSITGPTINFAGQVKDNALIDLYRGAKAVIFPQEEDFGLVPIEAQACGTPVIAFGKGGALETIISEKTGVFFGEQNEDSLVAAVKHFEKLKINPEECIKSALRFKSGTFEKQFKTKVEKLWSDHLADTTT